MKLKNKKVLVTGGAGFIGSHLVDNLLLRGAQVSVIDNLSTGNPDNLKAVKKDIYFQRLDIRDFAKIKPVIAGQDVVFHLAANADVPRGEREPEYEFSNNVTGSFNVLRSCLGTNIKKVIFASSAAVYGEPEYIPMDEKHPARPVSLYGVSKLYTENLGLAYFKTYGLPFTAVRIFNNYGERQRRFVMYDLLQKLYKNHKHLELLGTPDHTRDYCYVTDGAEFFSAIAESDKTTGDIFNLTGGHPVTIDELARTLIQVTGYKNVKITYTGKSWPGDVIKMIGTMDKVQKIVKFTPRVKLYSGLLLLHHWLTEIQKDK